MNELFSFSRLALLVKSEFRNHKRIYAVVALLLLVCALGVLQVYYNFKMESSLVSSQIDKKLGLQPTINAKGVFVGSFFVAVIVFLGLLVSYWNRAKSNTISYLLFPASALEKAVLVFTLLLFYLLYVVALLLLQDGILHLVFTKQNMLYTSILHLEPDFYTTMVKIVGILLIVSCWISYAMLRFKQNASAIFALLISNTKHNHQIIHINIHYGINTTNITYLFYPQYKTFFVNKFI